MVEASSTGYQFWGSVAYANPIGYSLNTLEGEAPDGG